MWLLLDNYDSFTYNVYQQLSEAGVSLEVIRNDRTTVAEVRRRRYDAIVISPGPGVPKEAGITEELIDTLKGEVPILGICLGHQAIGEVFGGKIIRHREIIHGKASPLRHSAQGIYAGLPQDIMVGRYHSLVIDRESLPDSLTVTSELADGTIMGVCHKEYPIEGVQFHPESILTPQGTAIIKNFISCYGC